MDLGRSKLCAPKPSLMMRCHFKLVTLSKDEGVTRSDSKAKVKAAC